MLEFGNGHGLEEERDDWMKKRILSILTCLILAVSLFPTAAVAAEEGQAAQVGSRTYNTLAEAIENAAPGETITLLRDYRQGSDDTRPCDLAGKTLDLNGKTYELGYPVFFFGDNGTVKNGTLTMDSFGREQYTMVIGGGASADGFTVDGVELNNGLSIANGTNVRLKNLTASTLGSTAVTSAVRMGKNCSATIESGRYTVNGIQSSAVYNNGGTLTINGGEFSASGSSAVAVLTGAMTDNECLPSTTIINAGTFTTKDSAYVLWNWSTLTINGGTFSSAGGFLNDSLSKADTTLNDGYFGGKQCFYSADEKLHLYGGYYENRPYPASGYTVILSDAVNYPYQVVEEDGSGVQVLTDLDGVRYDDSRLSPDLDDEEKEQLRNLTCSVDVLEEAARDSVARKLSQTEIAALMEQAADKLSASGRIYLYVNAYLEFAPVNWKDQKLSMEITPMYSIWASTSPYEWHFVEDEDGNGTPHEDSTVCRVQAPQPMQIDKPVQVQIGLPAGFVDGTETIYVEHVKNGQTYIYTAALKSVSSDPPPQSLTDGPAVVLADPGIRVQAGTDRYDLIFTTYHGFSPFTATTTAPAVTITGSDGVTIGYESLRAAANAAKDGEKIVLKSGSTHQLERLSEDKSVTVTNDTGAAVTIIYGGTAHQIPDGGSYVCTYTRPSSGGGASSYAVAVKDSAHGKVAASHKTASSGTTVTLTVTPDPGWALETLTVRTADGKELDLADGKSDGEYCFKMPGGRVTVEATFLEDNSVLNFFFDVPNDAYYYEAVKWAAGAGVTGGVGDSLFAPDRPCTRAQIVTFLWRAAGSPVVNYAMDMTDVSEDAYYGEAVRWALSQGITKGTGAKTFSPDEACTRAQAVTFLFRAVGKPAEDKAAFTDVPAAGYYADAVAWAVENGVTNGIGNGLFGPDQTCTRAQIVTFLYRAYLKK